ncbi:lariat debranching enzyme, C-terminal domain-containing protein [Lentinula edodes]|nr:lariat debranching enzyme, C-terminal domain-containing protein [Lentinula edodes]
MKIAIEGCCHGHLDSIYSSIADIEAKNNYHVDLLLICGDFQAVRNERDLQCMAVPNKYKHLGGFYKYYIGEKTAPILTVIIGGNHEASNYFWELFHGGWVAPNIYFLGNAGSVLINGIRISGASGIYKGHKFNKGYYERQPYNQDDLRSVYYIRESAIRQLSLLPPSSSSSSLTTIFLSHDWPLNITSYASPSNLNQLLREKPYFRQEVSEGKLGSPPLMGLLQVLRPRWWFSAHLHVGFDVQVWWETQEESKQADEEKVANPDEIIIDDEFESGPAKDITLVQNPTSIPPPNKNPDEIMLDDLDGDVDFDVAAPPAPLPPPPTSGSMHPLPLNKFTKGWLTQFVALDKCLPQRKFLEVDPTPTTTDTTASSPPMQHIPVSSAAQPILTFDPHWLAITRAFHSHISLTRQQKPFPEETTAREMVARELEWVKANVREEGRVPVGDVQQFVRTAPGPDGGGGRWEQPPPYSNPQTEAFCRMLMLDNFVNREASSS